MWPRFAAAVLAGSVAGTAAALSPEDFRDPEDGRFDTSRFLLDPNGFLPTPLVVTEPAIGYYVARAMGLHAGIDVARGPEDTAFYLIVGSAWR